MHKAHTSMSRVAQPDAYHLLMHNSSWPGVSPKGNAKTCGRRMLCAWLAGLARGCELAYGVPFAACVWFSLMLQGAFLCEWLACVTVCIVAKVTPRSRRPFEKYIPGPLQVGDDNVRPLAPVKEQVVR